jgi:hypothetical protein
VKKRKQQLAPTHEKHSVAAASAPSELPSVWNALFAEVRHAAPYLLPLAVIATVIRFFGLTESNLWMDEIVMLKEASAGRYQLISASTHIAHLKPVEWMLGLLGDTPFALRLWSAILGSLAISLFSLWALFSGGRRFAIGLTAVLALSNMLILYAQDANYYGGLTFYFAILLLGQALFLRGAFFVGLLLMAGAIGVGFKNHPISLLPAAVVGFTTLLAAFHPAVRRQGWSWSPREWPTRPLLPLLLLSVLAAIPVAIVLGPKIFSVIEPGSTKLTNVTPGLAIIWQHYHELTLNFFHPTPWQARLALIPLAMSFAGAGLLLRSPMLRERPALVALLLTIILLPIASYLALFSIAVKRAFYLRYFIFLTPCYLVLATMFLAVLRPIPINRIVLTVALLPILLPSAFFWQRMIWMDLRNYDLVPPRLIADGAIRAIVPHRNDLVQGRFFIGQPGLQTTAPTTTYLFEHTAADRLAGALPVNLNQERKTAVVSAWREADAPQFDALLDQLTTLRGTSRMGPEYGVQYAFWDHEAVLYPHLAFYPSSRKTKVLVINGGRWTKEGSEFAPTDSIEAGPILPVIPERLEIPWWQSGTPIVHIYQKLQIEPDGSRLLRLERDDSFDFLVHQPADEAPRLLRVQTYRRDEADPILKGNGSPIAKGMVIGIAVDGKHRGFYEVPSGPVAAVELPIALNLPAGNHRITVTGTQIRSGYTPFFAWRLKGLVWERSDSAGSAVKSFEEQGKIRVAAGWPTVPTAGEGPNVGGGWIVAQGDASVDPEVRDPSGARAIRLNLPNDRATGLLFAPPAAIRGGEVFVASLYVKLSGMETSEANPTILFLDEGGKPLGGPMPANGANLRGTTHGSGWVRRQVNVPAPDRAAFASVGIQIFGIKPLHESDGGVLWLGGVSTPGTDVDFADPDLPSEYFAAP